MITVVKGHRGNVFIIAYTPWRIGPTIDLLAGIAGYTGIVNDNGLDSVAPPILIILAQYVPVWC